MKPTILVIKNVGFNILFTQLFHIFFPWSTLCLPDGDTRPNCLSKWSVIFCILKYDREHRAIEFSVIFTWNWAKSAFTYLFRCCKCLSSSTLPSIVPLVFTNLFHFNSNAIDGGRRKLIWASRCKDW